MHKYIHHYGGGKLRKLILEKVKAEQYFYVGGGYSFYEYRNTAHILWEKRYNDKGELIYLNKINSISPEIILVSPDKAPNKYVYDNNSRGVLTIKLEIKKAVSLAEIGNDYEIKWECEEIGVSIKSWSPNNWEGDSTQGKGKTVTLSFTGLPEKNSDFGRKVIKASVYKNGYLEAIRIEEIKVFYDATASNSPSKASGTSDPNWFTYYKDASGGGDYTYDGISGVSEVKFRLDGTFLEMKIADDAFMGNQYRTTKLINNGTRRVAVGWSKKFNYWKNFMGVLTHEMFHKNNGIHRDSTDPDNDDLQTTFETGTVKSLASGLIPGTTRSTKFSIDNGVFNYTVWDDEMWAGGEVERKAIEAADITVDWASPGSQW